MSAGLDACVAHSASAHRDRLAWELGELGNLGELAAFLLKGGAGGLGSSWGEGGPGSGVLETANPKAVARV